MDVRVIPWYRGCEPQLRALSRVRPCVPDVQTFVIWGERLGEWNVPLLLFTEQAGAPVLVLVAHACPQRGTPHGHPPETPELVDVDTLELALQLESSQIGAVQTWLRALLGTRN